MWLTIKELSRKYKIGYKKIYFLAKEGYLPSKTKEIKLSIKRYGKVYQKKQTVILVDEEAWLEIPTFIRKKWQDETEKRREGQASGKKKIKN